MAKGIPNYSKHYFQFKDPFFEKIYGIKFITICPGGTETPILQSSYSRICYHDGLKESYDQLLANCSMQSYVCSYFHSFFPYYNNEATLIISQGQHMWRNAGEYYGKW